MTGSKFLGLTLKWNYALGFVNLSMSGYIIKALEKLQYILGIYPQYLPHKHHPTNYSRKKGKDQQQLK